MTQRVNLKAAVVLSAYNGEDYIEAQLDSLLRQVCLPGKVLIVDDCSNDGTFELVCKFISENGLSDTWMARRNDENLGWRRSFHDAIIGVGGDYIFPCDQDDIWKAEKISVMCEIMDAHPEINLLACSVAPFYESGSQKTTASTREVEGDPERALRRQPAGPGVLYTLRPGCAYCVRRAFIERIQPYWDSSRPHDEVLWQFAAIEESLFLLDKRLVDFRRHRKNASARRRIDKRMRITQLEYFIGCAGVLERYSAAMHCGSTESLAELGEMERWLSARLGFLNGEKRLSGFAGMLIGRQLYPTRKGLLVDLLLGLVPGLSLI